MLENNMRPKKVENVRVRKQNGEMAIFNILTADYFLLNETGVLIWKLCDGNHTITEIVEKIKEEFEDFPSVEKVIEDTQNLIQTLQEKQLIEVLK